MNSCILMAEIYSDPQLRYTADAQIPIAEMLVQFPNLGANQQMSTLKVVAWRDRAEELHKNYRAGDRVIIEGRLTMNVVELPAGYKEKRAELTASKIYPLTGEAFEMKSAPMSTTKSSGTAPATPRQEQNYSNVVPIESRRSAPSNAENVNPAPPMDVPATTMPASTGGSDRFSEPEPVASEDSEDEDLDLIPF